MGSGRFREDTSDKMSHQSANSAQLPFETTKKTQKAPDAPLKFRQG
jgi:hypothetical protein